MNETYNDNTDLDIKPKRCGCIPLERAIGFGIVTSIAAIASLIIIVGLSIPLLIQLKNGTYQKAVGASTSSQRRSKSGSCYSTYNLYLVYLAIPDLVYALWALSFHIIGYNATDSKQVKPLLLIDRILASTCFVSNLWLNAVVLYQVFLLLQSSKNARRINQPSLRRVTLQSIAIYFIAMTSGLSYFGGDMVWFGWNALIALPPIGYGIYVSIVVHRHRYLRSLNNESSTVRDKAIRELAIYFFRIIWVFVGVWVPIIVLYGLGTGLPNFKLGLFIGSAGPYIQAILTSCVILTKSDARKYVVDLVTFSYCRSSSKQASGNDQGSMITNGNKILLEEKKPPTVDVTEEKPSSRMDVVSNTMDASTEKSNDVQDDVDEEIGAQL